MSVETTTETVITEVTVAGATVDVAADIAADEASVVTDADTATAEGSDAVVEAPVAAEELTAV